MTSYLLRAALALLCITPAVAQASEAVPLAHFDSVGLSGGGHVTLKHGATQSVTLIKGSTQYTRFKVHGTSLEIEACNNSCPDNYDLEIEIMLPQITGVAIEGGGSIVAESGFPAQDSLAAAVSGGGGIDVRALPPASVEAAVNGGGIKVAASGTLNAAVNGGGHIAYWGNPKVSQAVSGGGSISRGS